MTSAQQPLKVEQKVRLDAMMCSKDEGRRSSAVPRCRRSGRAAMGALVRIDIGIGRVIVNVRSTGVVVV